MRIIVTGANSGVGKATAAALAAAGHSVVIACRTIPKGERAAAEMTGDVEVRHLDLADLPVCARSPTRWTPLMYS
jgi:NAD(P)-dependent dehydrogenase (short-subunit alcohol dehydrogenase family)